VRSWVKTGADRPCTGRVGTKGGEVENMRNIEVKVQYYMKVTSQSTRK